MRKASETARRRTAYHEAGHAVAAVTLGVRIKHVTIVPDARALGHLRHVPLRMSDENFYSITRRVRDRLERRIVVSLAGREAEWLVSGRYNHCGAAGDYQNALDFVFRLVGSSEEATAYFRWLEVRARQLVRAEHRRPQIDAVAAALLERHKLDGPTVIAIMQDAVNAAIRAQQSACSSPTSVACRRDAFR